MSIEGRIAVDIGFTDTYTASSVQSVQRITFTSADTYTSGKVAVITGTCSTANVGIVLAPTSYKDASGSVVSFTDVQRVAFRASAPCNYTDTDNSLVGVTIALFEEQGMPDIAISRTGTAGTASYTLVIYGT
jgi:hypothetical protein